MDYELAKQLKDAGFPQNTKWAYVGGASWSKNYEGQVQLMTMTKESNGYINLAAAGYTDVVSFPTLEELIEACGRDFICLDKKIDNDTEKSWLAGGGRREKEYFSYQQWASTPTEAVARLWLALHPIK